MAQNYLAYPDLGRDQFTGIDPDQDPQQFVQLIEKKFRFSHGDVPAQQNAIDDYNFRRKSYFATLLRGPAAESFETSITDQNTWDEIRERFITRFADGRNKFRHRMEAENLIRRDGEEIKNFLHRVKIMVGKGWPDDLAGVQQKNQNAERTAQERQRRQRCIEYSLKGLRPLKLREKAHEYLMDHPNANWDQFTQEIINKDLSYTVTSALTSGESHTDPIIQEMRDDIKGIKLQIKENNTNTINAVEKTADPNATGRRMATRFCSYCRTNGHTPNWCRKKMRDEEVKRVQNDRQAERKVTFTHDYNKRSGPSHGSRFPQNNSYRSNLPDRNDTSYNQARNMIAAKQLSLAGVALAIPTDVDRRPKPWNGGRSFNPQNQQRNRRPFSGDRMPSRSVSPGPQRTRSPFTYNRNQSPSNQRIQPLPPRDPQSAFQRPYYRNERPNQSQTYEQRFPSNNNFNRQMTGRHFARPSTVQFIDTEEMVNSVSDFRPLNF